MRRSWPIAILLALTACQPAADDTSGEDSDDTEEPTGTDLDQDGALAEEDCDDLDPRAYPGNEETWDGRDNDCDGVIDGRGTFDGTHAVEAVAIVEGQEVEMSLVCPVSLERAAGTFSFEVHCTPDPSDSDAMTLLGAEVTLTPVQNGVSAGSWSGDVSWTSSNGWSTTGIGHATWQDMDEVWLATGLDTVSLEWSGTGTVLRASP